MSNTRECLIRLPNTEKRAENTILSGTSRNVKVFGNLFKHYLKWSIYLLIETKTTK